MDHSSKLHRKEPLKLKRLLLNENTGQFGYKTINYGVKVEEIERTGRIVTWTEEDTVRIERPIIKKPKLQHYHCKHCSFSTSDFQETIDHNVNLHKTEPLVILCLRFDGVTPISYRSKSYDVIPSVAEDNKQILVGKKGTQQIQICKDVSGEELQEVNHILVQSNRN